MGIISQKLLDEVNSSKIHVSDVRSLAAKHGYDDKGLGLYINQKSGHMIFHDYKDNFCIHRPVQYHYPKNNPHETSHHSIASLSNHLEKVHGDVK